MSDKSGSGATATTLLKQLIRCPSVTPKEAGALDVVQNFLAPLGFICTRMVFDGDNSYPVDNLFASRGNSGRHLLFGGHTDVVPAGNQTLWSHQPFAADEAHGHIWGRGAVDMKSGVAAFCAAAAIAVNNGNAERGIISLAITSDEEADAINGTDKLLKWAADAGHRFDFAVVGEPSSASVLGDNIKIGRRGSISGVVGVKGKQGHSAYPERASNPVPVLARLGVLLSGAELDEGSEHFQASNLEVTSIDVANAASNVIPAEGHLSFNIRFNDLWTHERICAWIDQRLDEVRQDGFEIKWAQVAAVAHSFVSPLSKDIKGVQNAVRAITGLTPDLATFGGTSDARFIARYCPVVECGLVGTTMHQTDERVEIVQLEKLTKIYAEILSNFF